MLTIAIIDQQLSQQGKFCLIDWLLSENLLYYAAYEDWRYGRIETLEPEIQLASEALAELMKAVETHCRALELNRESQDFYRWDERGGLLLASGRRENHDALTHQWLRSQDLPQRDLFMDNSAVMAENRLREALAGRQFDQAQLELQQLVSLNSQHLHLGAYQDLLNYGQHMQANQQIHGSEALETELQGLQQEVLPLSQEVLGQGARDYLALAWYRLADNLDGQAFDPAKPQLHRSYALLQIPDWPQLNDCLERTPDLYKQPVLLERLAITRAALQRREAALLTWCVMMERFSEDAEKAIEAGGQSPVAELWDSFWEFNDAWPNDHFPAFVLARHPGLLRHLQTIPALERPASQAMIALLKCRQVSADEIVARERLQNISPVLLQMYLQERGASTGPLAAQSPSRFHHEKQV